MSQSLALYLLLLALFHICTSFQPLSTTTKVSTRHHKVLTPLCRTPTRLCSSISLKDLSKGGQQQKPGHHFKLNHGHMEFGAYDQVEVTMNKENQERVEQYMNESPERVLLATWDENLIERKPGGLFRLTTHPVTFVSIQLQPSLDIQVAMEDGFLTIASQAFYLNGLEKLLGRTFSNSLKIEVEGRLRAISDKSGVKLVGEVLFLTSGKLPMFLSLTPKSVLERAALVVNSRIMNYAKGRFMRNLAADVEAWASNTYHGRFLAREAFDYSARLPVFRRTMSQSVAEYYTELQSTLDLKTSACCTGVPPKIRKYIADIHEEVLKKFYGCGSPLPDALEGCTVLDLGCGSGRDCFIAARLVGPKGRVIGVDMTTSQLAVAQRYLDWHMERLEYQTPNVTFVKGFIEDLATAGIQDNSVDVVISNCVLNLSPDKPRVFKEIFRVLKPGGELYFSDVFADRRLPAHLREDKEVLGECLGGALYLEDFRRLMAEVGCRDYRVVDRAPITIRHEGIALKVGAARFESVTVRAFKLPELEDRCEDYGQVVYYKGTIPGHPLYWNLDDHHLMETNKPFLICGNTALMLTKTRFAPHFRVEGDTSIHYGLFPCGNVPKAPSDAPGSCC